MLYRLRSRLSLKLSLAILVLAVPIFVLSLGILFVQSRNNVKEEATEHAQSIYDTMMQRVCRYLYTVETATNANAWKATEYLHPDSLLHFTHTLVRMNPHTDGCSVSTEPDVFPEYGRYFSAYSIREGDSVKTVIEEEYEYFERVWYKTPRDLGHSCWVNYYDEADSLDLTLEGMIASYCRPLYTSSGQFVGVISTDISLLHLSKIIAMEKPYPHSYFMMLSETGSYFIHPDSTRLFHQSVFDNADPMANADVIALGHEMTAGNKGSMWVAIDGRPCLVCYGPMPGTHWSLAFVCPESDFLQSYHRLAYIILALIVLGLLVIHLFIYRSVALAIRPLNHLLEKTQSITAGDYEVHIPRSRRKDAVGQLQNSFATMLQSLNFHMGSIRYMADQAERRNAELAHATRLAEESDRHKTAFIQNVTHQIRTPLNIIMGFAQVLRDYTRPQGSSLLLSEELSEDEMKNITSTMNHNALILTRMVQMLFDSSASGITEELKDHQCEVVSCNDVARESIEYTHMHFPDSRVEFTTELPDDFCIHTSRLYLMRSLRELLYNSAKYSDGQNMMLRVEKTGQTVRFIFQDTGKGISQSYRDLMFEPFTKVDDLSEGLGLGLPLAKRHIQNLGGNLILDADYHDGCRFIIELPAK